MVDFEQGFADAERAALAVERAARDISKAAKQMEKAAQEGDIKKLRKAAAGVDAATGTARQEGVNARSAWPFNEDDEQKYLEGAYVSEFIASAKSAGLMVHERDERLIAFPSIVQVLAKDRAVRIDRRKVHGLRPSHLASALKDNQSKPPRPKSEIEAFLGALYRAYRLLSPGERFGTMAKLVDVYQALTLQPGAAAEYGKSEFARDLLVLDQSGITLTSSGAKMLWGGAPSAKGAERDRISTVARDGEVKTYYGLQFTEERK